MNQLMAPNQSPEVRIEALVECITQGWFRPLSSLIDAKNLNMGFMIAYPKVICFLFVSNF